MKIHILFIGCTLFFWEGNAYNLIQEPIVTAMQIGKNHLTNQDIYGIEYKFQDKTIGDFIIDTVNQLLKVKVFSDYGSTHIVAFDLVSQKNKWSSKVFPQYDEILFTQKHIIYSQHTTNSLDVATGIKLWEIQPLIWYYDEGANIGLAKQGRNVVGVNLASGGILWENKEFRMNTNWSIMKLSDSTILLDYSGLHVINIFTGKSWKYKADTNAKYVTGEDVAGSVGIITVGIVAAIIGLRGSGGTMPKHVVSNINSNILLDSGKIYFASKDKMICFMMDGTLVWQHPLPTDFTSTSFVFIKDGLLYIRNRGYADINGTQKSFGRPFVSAYNLDNGNQQLFQLDKGRGWEYESESDDSASNTPKDILDSKYKLSDIDNVQGDSALNGVRVQRTLREAIILNEQNQTVATLYIRNFGQLRLIGKKLYALQYGRLLVIDVRDFIQ